MMARILIIDDEESIRFTLDKFLQFAGHQVFTARNYEEAIRFISGDRFDIIFADIMLDGKSGLTVLREIRNKDKNCPVVMITGFPHVDSASEALRLKAFDYIAKPITQEKLLSVIARALQQKALADQQEKYLSNVVNVFRSIKNAIMVVGNDRQLLEINDMAEKLCGLSPMDLRNGFASPFEQCQGRCMDIIMGAKKGVQIAEKVLIECNHVKRPGQVVSLSSFPLYDCKGSVDGAVMIIKDVTPGPTTELLTTPRKKLHHIVGQSAEMQKIYDMIEILSDLQTTVLITGDSGTGKELVAEALHFLGERAEQPLVKVNCAALSDDLLGSELFGHVKGAFTGAIQDRIGRFKKADGGSIFLDEIGDISPALQSRLLRVMQEREFERVGDSTTLKVDVRIITATNSNLIEKVREGTFRKDLYYRLKVVEMSLPPLRKRREDIPLLVDHYINNFNTQFHKNILSVSADVMELFMNYDWDGNVRELKHTLEYAFINCRQSVIDTIHLPPEFATASKIGTDNLKTKPDCENLIDALQKTNWNKTRAAQLLGISRRTFYRRIYDCNIMEENSHRKL